MNNIILYIILIILVYILFNCLNKNIYNENFVNIIPGILQNVETNGILDNFYKDKEPPKLSEFNYAEQSKAYPIFPAKSYMNNNIKLWPTPTNGTCVFPELCNNFYNVLNCEKQKLENINNINIWPSCKNPRINFWCSNLE